MSPSLSRIGSSARRALEKRPSDWEPTRTAYPIGKNPWFDLYPETKAAQIGKVVGLSEPDEICNLRLLLAHAANEALKSFRLIGGPASDGKKREWAARTFADAKRFKITLLSGDGHFSTDVRLTMRGDKKVARIVPSSVIEKSVTQLIVAIDKFIELVEPATKQPVKTPGAVSEPTSHSIYLQSAVNLVTEVFIYFRGLEPVRRISDNEGVHGEYPDFCRLAADPILCSYYPEYTRRRSKLDGQIQDAAARYRGRKR